MRWGSGPSATTSAGSAGAWLIPHLVRRLGAPATTDLGMEADMARKPDSTAPPEPKPVVIRLDEPDTSDLRIIGGSRSDRFNNALIDSMINTGWFPRGQSDEDRNRQLFVAVTGLRAFAPADEIEGMIAAQTMAAHHASMECSRRAMLHEQPFEAAQGLRKAAANASRTFVELLSALDRKRGKGGQQVVRVEHVHVHPGGKAIVGSITKGGPGGGGAHEIPEEPRARGQLAHSPLHGAVLSPLRGTDAKRETVPRSGDAEPPLSDARRQVHRPADAGGSGADTGGSDNARHAHGRDGRTARVGAGVTGRR